MSLVGPGCCWVFPVGLGVVPWVSLGASGCLWVSLGAPRCSWVALGGPGCPWVALPLKDPGCALVPLGFLGFPGCPWVPLGSLWVLLECPWTPFIKHWRFFFNFICFFKNISSAGN